MLIAAGIALPALILLSRTGEDDDEKPLPPPPPAPAAVVAAAPASGAPLPPPPAPEVPEVCRPVVDAAERANAKLKCPSSELAMLGGFCDRISRMSPECIGKWKKLTDCVVAAPVSFWSCTQEGMDFESPACSALLPPIQKCF